MPQGQIDTYFDVTPQKRVITDVISLIDPSDTPCVEALGGLDGAMEKFRFVNWPSTTVEWLEDTLAPLADLLSASITSNTTTITLTDGDKFQAGHIIAIDSEQMWVSAVVTSTEVLTVTRAYSGTAATHAASAVVTIVGMARLEGADSNDSPFTDRTVGSNYTQIFHKQIKVTRSQNQISQYGIAEEFDYQASKAIPELLRLIEKQLFVGARKAGSATTPRAFGGFSTFITGNYAAGGGAAITQAGLENALKAAWADGGTGPWIAPVTASHMQTIKGFYENTSYLRVDRGEKQVGMVIESVMTPYGQLDLVMDRWAEQTRINCIDPKNAGLATFYPFTQEPLALDGDYQKGEVVGEFVLCVRQDNSHAAVTNLI
jgi:hypothetical protein